MDKTEEIKIYIEHLLYNYLQFYELSKSAKSFNYDIMEELDKITESMNIILNSIDFTPNDLDLKEYVRDFRLNKLLNKIKMEQIKQVFQKHGIFCSVIPTKQGSLDKFMGWIYIPQNETTKDISVGDYKNGFSTPNEVEEKIVEKLKELGYI